MKEPAARPGAHKALVPLHLREDGMVFATRSLPTRDTDRGIEHIQFFHRYHYLQRSAYGVLY